MQEGRLAIMDGTLRVLRSTELRDFLQQPCIVEREQRQLCWIDGVEYRFSDLVKDPNMSHLVTSNGPLKNDRQPGVQQITGQQVLFPVVIVP